MQEEAPKVAREDQVEAAPSLEGAYSSEGVDLTVIHWMLSLTPLERLEAAEDLIDAAAALKRSDEA